MSMNTTKLLTLLLLASFIYIADQDLGTISNIGYFTEIFGVSLQTKNIVLELQLTILIVMIITLCGVYLKKFCANIMIHRNEVFKLFNNTIYLYFASVMCSVLMCLIFINCIHDHNSLNHVRSFNASRITFPFPFTENIKYTGCVWLILFMHQPMFIIVMLLTSLFTFLNKKDESGDSFKFAFKSISKINTLLTAICISTNMLLFIYTLNVLELLIPSFEILRAKFIRISALINLLSTSLAGYYYYIIIENIDICFIAVE